MSKIDHTNTVCCNCGSNKTYMRLGRPDLMSYLKHKEHFSIEDIRMVGWLEDD